MRRAGVVDGGTPDGCLLEVVSLGEGVAIVKEKAARTGQPDHTAQIHARRSRVISGLRRVWWSGYLAGVRRRR
jgi:hypothetical protein